MNVNYMRDVEMKGCLSDSFILDLAIKKLNVTEIELGNILGRYKIGKKKGLLKGLLVWCKVIKGGWVKTGKYDHELERANGFVARLGIRYGYHICNWDKDGCLDIKIPKNCDDDYFVNDLYEKSIN